MCGICGFNWEDRELIKHMCDAIKHRGPDGEGVYTDKSISLGHRRLSIIDLSERGKQPMCNENETIWLTYNGEIYNFRDLRTDLEKRGHIFKSNTDTEVIIHSYEEWGVDCVKKFNGMFAFAIWDSNKKILFLARDRLGIKPLYYYWDGKSFIFASEMKALITHDFEKKINIAALHNFLSFRCTLNESILESTYKLLPGHILIYDGKVHMHKFWDFNIVPNLKISIGAAEKILLEKLKNAVKLRLMSEVSLGAYLSGGVDSGTIVGLMSQLCDTPVKTFSVGFGYQDENDELEKARMIAEHFGADHHEIIVDVNAVKILPDVVWHSDEPLADPACIPVYILSKNVKKHATVVLTGDGSDEIFAGYEQIKMMQMHHKYITPLPSFVKNSLGNNIQNVPKNILDTLFKYSSALGVEGKKRMSKFITANTDAERYLAMVEIFDENEKKQLFANKIQFNNAEFIKKTNGYFKGNDFIANVMNLDTNYLLANNILMKVDKTTMAFGVEARVPFLDHKLVEFVNSLPSNLKLNGFKDKYILRRCAAKMLPKEVSQRKKQRFFVPLDKWFDGELMSVTKQLLYSSDSKYYDINYLNKIFGNFSHSKLFYGRQLWALLTFELWHKMYIEGIDRNKITKTI